MEVNPGINRSQVKLFVTTQLVWVHLPTAWLVLGSTYWISLKKIWEPLYKPASMCVLAMNSDKGADWAGEVSGVSSHSSLQCGFVVCAIVTDLLHIWKVLCNWDGK